MSLPDWLWLLSWSIWSWHYVRTERRIAALALPKPEPSEPDRILAEMFVLLRRHEKFTGTDARWLISKNITIMDEALVLSMERLRP